MYKSDIVVAKYKEDVTWIDSFKDPSSVVYIYDKSGGECNSHEVIPLENIGRESHTYLHHIVSNYDSMDASGVTLFTQGNPFDHYSVHTLKKLIPEAKKNGFSVSTTSRAIPGHNCTRTFTLDVFGPVDMNVVTSRTKEHFGPWFERVTRKPFPQDPFWFVIAAVFAVRNDLILSKPKEYYQNMMNEFDGCGSNPEVGHFFERSWYYIMNDTTTHKKTLSLNVDPSWDVVFRCKSAFI